MSNERTPSTRAVWVCEKILSSPKGTSTARRSRSELPFLPKRDWRRSLTLTVAYRGSAEPLIEVKARGRTWMFSGHDCFLDVMMAIWDDNPGGARGVS